MTIKLIVGLGNPGIKYKDTRHNAGSWYVKSLINHYFSKLDYNDKFYGYTGKLIIGGKDIHILIPTTFINISGKAVIEIAKFYKIPAQGILVAHDELDLKPGIIKFKFCSNHTSSHRGVKDIINCLGNCSQFCRLRIGIGHPGNKNEVVNFVLDKPTIEERNLINNAINEAVYSTKILIVQGIIKAVNYLHACRFSKDILL